MILLIPPSSIFLKTLANYFLSIYSLNNENILKVWCIFPTKRAGLYFKYYLKKKASSKKFNFGFLPKILSFEEFVDYLYLLLTENPFSQVSEVLRVFIFLEILEKVLEEKEDLERHFHWGLKFLEVFEEFEKEGKIPENLLYPPEGLPEIAQKFFETLKTTYLNFSSLIEKKNFSYYTLRLKKIAEILKEKVPINTLSQEIKEIWFIGFAGLRKTETEIFKFFKKYFTSYFIFEADLDIPSVIKETLKSLNLEYRWIEEKYYEKRHFKEPEIYFYETSDPHLQVKSAVELLEKKIENPDEIVIVVPNSLNLLPLLYALEDKENSFEINITLQYPINKIPLNQLLRNVIRAQKEREGEYYPIQSYLKILKHPYLSNIKLDEWVSFSKTITEIEKELRKKGYVKILLSEVEELFPDKKEFLSKVHHVFFKNWENINNSYKMCLNLKKILEFFEPFFEKSKDEDSWHSILLRNYLHILEKKVFPVLEDDFLKDKKFSQTFLLELLEQILREENIHFIGDPLKGLQIMGFLETRLLSFKKVIILDVNEGYLPASPSFNPLLTEEIKNYLGIPIFKNELWFYYFDRLIKSAEEVHLFYLFVEKGKTQEFREPSRFIQKLKWDIEKKDQKPKEKLLHLKLEIFSEKEGIPKSEKDRERILNLIKTSEISRYFLETYLRCGVQFYFKYLLKLKEVDKFGLKPVEVGNFIHEFFERIFKEFEGKEILINEIYDEKRILKRLDLLWESYQFERKMDALSHFLSKKLAIESIRRYFNYLIEKEKRGEIKSNKILGVERELIYFTNWNGLKILLKGRADFLIKRVGNFTQYFILDYKSNPDSSPHPNKAKALLNLNLPKSYDQNSIYEVTKMLGNDLYSFQPLFYYYLFYQQKEKFITEQNGEFFIINAGFITPSDFKKPEKFLFNVSKIGEWNLIYKFFKTDFFKLIEWILNHIIISDKFYFSSNDEVCKYCVYKDLCKNYKYLID